MKKSLFLLLLLLSLAGYGTDALKPFGKYVQLEPALKYTVLLPEKPTERDLFAAELLLEDGEVLDALNRDTTFFSAAAVLLVPAELLDFKFRVMKWKGFKMIEPPISARSNFMKDMEIPEDADFYS